MIAPSTTRSAPSSSAMPATVAGDTALASTKSGPGRAGSSCPATSSARARAASGGHTEMITSARRVSSATSGTPIRSAVSARFDVVRLRPAAAQITAPAVGLSAAPTAAPMAPGCMIPITGRDGSTPETLPATVHPMDQIYR